ncbi:hypothetical protein SISSUDRAFT_981080 [Sistotremastrum suecicum HHB10207 ss-3]|uniref:Uncharacterized protein n=1 Tax=Sistotremastrum suecicum HHB10207 ss-3 TaxID=1314776 RepID=A0A166GRU9_9AGAM|nr:hypothetical protein SISSUDRAFT_981080 [Sistotremastrum suecicum HHB10207 ss-3]
MRRSLRRQLAAQDKRQEDRLEEIKYLLKDVLKEQIIEHLKKQVEAQIADTIAAEVQESVAAELKDHIPASLQDQVMEHKRQLDEVQRALHNSEARRANALLRSTHLQDPLHPLLMSNDEVSPRFPKDLSGLFALDSTTAKALAEDYELPDVSESRERNLNRLMVFLGVAYQMVWIP